MEWSWLKWLLRVFKGCDFSVFATIYKPVWKGMKVSITIPHHPSPSIIIHPTHTLRIPSFHDESTFYLLRLRVTSFVDYPWLEPLPFPPSSAVVMAAVSTWLLLRAFKMKQSDANRGVSWWIIYFWIIRKSASKNLHTFGKFHREHPFWEFIYKSNLISTQWCRNSASTTRQSFVNYQELCISWPTLYIIFSFLEHKKGSKKDVHTGNLGSGSNLRKLLMQMLRQLLLFTLEFPEKPGRLWNSGICSSQFQVASCISHKVTYQISLSISQQHLPCLLVANQPKQSIFQSPDVRLDPWHFLRPVQSLCRR